MADQQLTVALVHGIISGGVGHNLPQEASEAFREAILEVDGFA
jgi:hypothetical protein